MHICFLFIRHCNKELSTYLDNIEVEHVLGTPYHPQSEGAFERFNKTVQRELSKAYDTLRKMKTRNLSRVLLAFISFTSKIEWDSISQLD